MSNALACFTAYSLLTGLDSFSGKKSTGPSLSGLQIADIAAGSKNLAMAVMAAVIKRTRSGEGDYIDISITDSTFAMTLFSTAPFLHGGRLPAQEEEMLNGGSLYDYYQTSDGRYLSVGPIETKFFHTFCKKAGCAGYADTGIGNIQIKEEISKIIREKTLAEWEELFQDVDACVEPVLTIEETMNRPPISERDMVIKVHDARGQAFKQIGNPVKFRSGSSVAETAGVPIGTHNEEILERATFTLKEIDLFRADKVIV